MTSVVDLIDSRKKLEESLGDSRQSYFDLLKQWFQMKSTREEFYMESRKLLSGNQVLLHNTFLLNLFNTCQFPTTTVSDVSAIAPIPSPTPSTSRGDKDKNKDKDKDKSKKSKARRRTRTERDRGRFEYADAKNYAPIMHPLPRHSQDEPVRYCQQEFFLPDASHMRGRMMITAWENGLDGASSQAAECLVVAVQYFLKNILTSIFSQRSGYKVREDRFQHSLGTLVPSPLVRHVRKNFEVPENDIESEIDSDSDSDSSDIPKPKPTFEELEQQAMLEISSSIPRTTVKAPVSAFDLLHTLQTTRKQIPIPSHPVYSLNVARIIARLNHPTREEMEGGQERRKKIPKM